MKYLSKHYHLWIAVDDMPIFDHTDSTFEALLEEFASCVLCTYDDGDYHGLLADLYVLCKQQEEAGIPFAVMSSNSNWFMALNLCHEVCAVSPSMN